MVFVKKSKFLSSVVFGGKSSQKRQFLDILDRTECFFDQTSEIVKKVKKIEMF